MTRITINATEIANYIIATGASRRQAAQHFGINKNTLNYHLNKITGELAEQIAEIAKRNKHTKPATRTESPVELTTQPETRIAATGIRSSNNCHPVLGIDTGEIYASGADAAEALGVTQGSISQHIIGMSRSCKGLRFCKVADMKNSITAISESIKTANAKAEIIKAEAEAKFAEEKTAMVAEINAIKALNEVFADDVYLLNKIRAMKTKRDQHLEKAEELRKLLNEELIAAEEADKALSELYTKL